MCAECARRAPANLVARWTRYNVMLAYVADNPQQAESSSNADNNANYWCQADMSGGPDKPGPPRTPEGTIESIKKQIWTACLGVQDAVDTLQTKTGVKDRMAVYWIQQLVNKARETQQDRLYTPGVRDAQLDNCKIKGVEQEAIKASITADIQKELYEWVFTQPAERYTEILIDDPSCKDLRPGNHYNILLRLPGINPHHNCEILHTVLLGVNKYIWYQTNKVWDKKKDKLFATVNKYIWYQTNKVWDKKKDKLFATRLQSSSVDGLTLSPLCSHYMVQYKNSLISKHFKAIQQLGVFHLHNDLCTKEVFDLWKANGKLGAMIWYPENNNMEFYLLDLEVLIDNVLDLWSVVDPARIQYKYKLHVLPHLKETSNDSVQRSSLQQKCLSKWWLVEGYLGGLHSGRNMCPIFLLGNKELQRCLGWVNAAGIQAGRVKLLSKTKQNPKPWKDALGRVWTTKAENEGTWITCKHVISRAHNVCKASDEQAVYTGCTLNILALKLSPQLTAGTVVVVEVPTFQE
ncbi:hypothetical protein B0H34DRAFT_679361 [Crassisporium funariophilum]|nr:hypothetical protein B0H34DRAFT_679361 [Crassisporium funariophilum]